MCGGFTGQTSEYGSAAPVKIYHPTFSHHCTTAETALPIFHTSARRELQFFYSTNMYSIRNADNILNHSRPGLSH